MQTPTNLLLALAVSAGTAFAQASSPAGVQRIGNISLTRAESKTFPASGPVETTTDSAVAVFSSIDTSIVSLPMVSVVTIDGCNVTTFTLPLPLTPIALPKVLDAGPAINVNGPNGAKQIPPFAGVGFIGTLGGGTGTAPLYLDPGTYTVDNGAGGADVGAFTVTLNVPSPGFVWTNADANLTIDRTAGVEVQWTGGDPATTVTIGGAVSSPTVRALFACVVPNNGDFVVTSNVLSLMPASGAGPGNLSTMTAANTTQVGFSAPGLDTGTFTYSVDDQRTVVYQ